MDRFTALASVAVNTSCEGQQARSSTGINTHYQLTAQPLTRSTSSFELTVHPAPRARLLSISKVQYPEQACDF